MSWDFQIDKPGEFQIEILQGCGTGSGGSRVDFEIAPQTTRGNTTPQHTLTATVEETGGFQQFVPRKIGTVTLATAGRYLLAVKPRSKPGPAVMDLRQVKLIPVAPKP